jgi:hypothetical protein
VACYEELSGNPSGETGENTFEPATSYLFTYLNELFKDALQGYLASSEMSVW